MERIPAVEMRGITKRFGNVIANNNAAVTVYHSEIVALLGENGSGKTSLMNMLSGIYYPDEGEIFVNGKRVSIVSPKDAMRYKIGMIHQHFKLVDVFSAAENIVMGLKEQGAYNLKTVAAKVEEIASRYGFEINPYQKVYDMSVSEKQTLEIIKILYRGADILILDEPTAVLTPLETRKLFSVIRNLKDDQKSIIIITHKLQEVLEISDRVTILRKGEFVGSVATKEATELSLTEMMVGKKVQLNIERPEVINPTKKLTVSNLSCLGPEGLKALDDVSFEVYTGEILGIAGISGCGQKELLEAIAGLQKVEEGSSIIWYDEDSSEQQIVGMSPREIRDLGISLSFVPEDRLGMGLVGSMGMTENMMLKTYNKSAGVFVQPEMSEELANDLIRDLLIVTPDVATPLRLLSGGNIQKVLVGREISSVPSVLMTAYAVRGLDINTSYAIYDLLNQQKRNGVAVIYVGEDLDVLLALSDKILVLCSGKVSGLLDGRTATKEEVGLLMTNSKKEDEII